MALIRLIITIFGLSLILGLMIWLVTSFSALYTQIAWAANPFLANLLLLLLVALLGVALYGFFHYTRLFRSGRKSRQRPPLKVPADKAEAAVESLKALQQQVAQIQDDVAKQALLDRSQDIAANLSRGRIRLVVFGTGSAGKTSIVNALIGRMVGQVSAPMGTTTAGETYYLSLAGLDREILITDTPGILEASILGTQRGEVARSLATEANLLLFVVDNDLRQSESQPLKILAEIGKRSLLVFNKIDLFPEADREIILERLRGRVYGVIAPEDVVAVTANPQILYLSSGETLQPDPEIAPLIQRIAQILRQEGEELIADNILLQSQRLGTEARQLIDDQRRRQAEKIVERYQWIGAGAIALTPLPVVDLLATAAVNAQMVVELGKIYGCELNRDRGQELALSLAKTLGSLGIVQGTIQLVARGLQLHFGTFVIGKGIQAVSAAYLTRIAGRSFIEYFRQDQDWGDGGMTEVVQQQFQLNRQDEFVRRFIKDAMMRVIEPLNLREDASNPDASNPSEDIDIELKTPELPKAQLLQSQTESYQDGDQTADQAVNSDNWEQNPADFRQDW
ncbi:MAG: DUF697 domain-containing protein [Oscillatoriales cyanobacterium RM2_1_1]|nr:DUF697 domain-containing protein [Oscillatoriales cyanobacterium RM2_1_1]